MITARRFLLLGAGEMFKLHSATSKQGFETKLNLDYFDKTGVK